MKQPLSKEVKKELKSTALNIEFLVISVIQGMALQMLAAYVIPIFSTNQIEYWFYAASGFMLILAFWSQSIIHALSFIDWPIDLTHTFLYFLASFIEVMTFSQITDPLRWFIFGLVFVLVSGLLYGYDFFMIKRYREDAETTAAGKRLYRHIYNHHVLEMAVLVPAAIIFNSIAIWLIYTNPTVYIQKHYHVVLGGIQTVFTLILLISSVYSYKRRSNLITDAVIV